eukprot:scaffold4955_cov53-Phaeocystis_antarctica.AAC.3
MQGSRAGAPTTGRRPWRSVSTSPSPRASPSRRAAGPGTAAARRASSRAAPATPRRPARCFAVSGGAGPAGSIGEAPQQRITDNGSLARTARSRSAEKASGQARRYTALGWVYFTTLRAIYYKHTRTPHVSLVTLTRKQGVRLRRGRWAPLLDVLLQLLVDADAEALGLLLERHEEVRRLGHGLLRRLQVLVVGHLDLDQRAQVRRRLRQRARRLGAQPR